MAWAHPRGVLIEHMHPPCDPTLTLAAARDVLLAGGMSAARIAQVRHERLQALLAHAARHAPIYRQLAGRSRGTPSLQDFPVMPKAQLMQRFDEWVTDPGIRLAGLRDFVADPSRIADPYLGRYVVWESSGSSGVPGIFVQDAGAMAVYDALEALRRPVTRPLQRWLDPWYATERIAFIGATEGHYASVVSSERLRRLNPALSNCMHNVSFMQPWRRLVEQLEAIDPTIIATYPSVAMMLAEEKSAGRLDVRPEEILTGGESLTPPMRRFIESTFGRPVVNRYGASEFFSLACECRWGRMHLNSDWALLEPVDKLGRAVPAGETGATVLLTNLANRVQPLIRYDLGDRVAIDGTACPCGSVWPVIRVEGRSDDLLHLPTAGRARVGVSPLALTSVVEDQAGLFDFQLEQTAPRSLCLHTPLQGAAAGVALRRARTALLAFFAEQGVTGLDLRVAAGTPSRRGPGGKTQRVVGLPLQGHDERRAFVGAALRTDAAAHQLDERLRQ